MDPIWHESDDFWKTMAPMMFGEERLAGTTEEIDHVAPLLGIQTGDAILDMGCGMGRHSLELARRGYHVTGVDRTETYLHEARKTARKEGLEVDFILSDMRKFISPDSYQAALSMYSTFGYFEDQEENQQVLRNIYQSLNLGGTLILDMMGKEVLARIFIEKTWEEQNGMLFLQEHKVSRNWSWRENRWIMVRDGELYEYKVSHWVYSASELADMLKDSGFCLVDIYGDLEGASYDQNARRLVVIAQK